MDEIDRVQAMEELERGSALARRPMQVGIACLACGEEIAPERRAALPGCCLCVECQGAMERSAWQ